MLVLVVMLVVFKGQFPTGAATWFLVALVVAMAGSIQFLCALEALARGAGGPGQWWMKWRSQALRSIRLWPCCAAWSPQVCPGRLNFHCHHHLQRRQPRSRDFGGPGD